MNCVFVKKTSMVFDELPKELKNIIAGYAYDMKWQEVVTDLQMCEKVRRMDISGVFTRQIMWSKKHREYIPSPLIAFHPIRHYTGCWADYIDWHSVQELLWRLDFRLRFVRFCNSRYDWRESFKKNWENIKVFDHFYRFLLYTRVPCFKPLWKRCGFSCLKSYRSPCVTARWWLDCDSIYEP